MQIFHKSGNYHIIFKADFLSIPLRCLSWICRFENLVFIFFVFAVFVIHGSTINKMKNLYNQRHGMNYSFWEYNNRSIKESFTGIDSLPHEVAR